MEVLGISGSPRADGNTELLLKAALEPFSEKGWTIVEFFLSNRSVAPCDGCDECRPSGECIIRDDMDLLYEKFVSCDAFIIGSPVYYRNVSAQLKAVFDRHHSIFNDKPLTGKAGSAIVVGRGASGGQSLTLSIIYNFILSAGAIGIPGQRNGLSAVADKPGDVLAQPGTLKQARILGQNVLKYAELIRSNSK
jgi:multimeric flavodoxin WrbA